MGCQHTLFSVDGRPFNFTRILFTRSFFRLHPPLTSCFVGLDYYKGLDEGLSYSMVVCKKKKDKRVRTAKNKFLYRRESHRIANSRHVTNSQDSPCVRTL